MTDRPEILDTETEHEILYQRVVEGVCITLEHGPRQDLTVGEGLATIAGLAVTSTLMRLRVMSARQLAVLLAQQADRHAGYEIREPPHYTAQETEGVTG